MALVAAHPPVSLLLTPSIFLSHSLSVSPSLSRVVQFLQSFYTSRNIERKWEREREWEREESPDLHSFASKNQRHIKKNIENLWKKEKYKVPLILLQHNQNKYVLNYLFYLWFLLSSFMYIVQYTVQLRSSNSTLCIYLNLVELVPKIPHPLEHFYQSYPF